MRRLTLCSSTDQDEAAAANSNAPTTSESESEYVSLADLPTSSLGASRSLSLLVLYDGRDSHGNGDNLAPLNEGDTCRIRRLQDALLLAIGGLSLLLACWVYAQAYRGRMCVTTTSFVEANATSVDCVFLKNESRLFTSRGGPDLLWRDGSFDGGWPLSHVLLHVFASVALLLSIVVMRLQSSSIHESLAWVWFCLLHLSILALDALRLWRWRGPTCTDLLTAIAPLLEPTTHADVGRCVTVAYELLVSVEMLLVVLLLLLVLLEPVLFRLWWGTTHVETGPIEKLEPTH